MGEIMIGFSQEELDMIIEYQKVSESVTIQVAIMNAISIALDRADK